METEHVKRGMILHLVIRKELLEMLMKKENSFMGENEPQK